jgi:hypothetical protein
LEIAVKTMITVPTPLCPECKCYGEITIDFNDWEIGKTRMWAGELIQNCFPTLTPAQREQLINGFHDKCWDSMFGGAK